MMDYRYYRISLIEEEVQKVLSIEFIYDKNIDTQIEICNKVKMFLEELKRLALSDGEVDRLLIMLEMEINEELQLILEEDESQDKGNPCIDEKDGEAWNQIKESLKYQCEQMLLSISLSKIFNKSNKVYCENLDQKIKVLSKKFSSKNIDNKKEVPKIEISDEKCQDREKILFDCLWKNICLKSDNQVTNKIFK